MDTSHTNAIKPEISSPGSTVGLSLPLLTSAELVSQFGNLIYRESFWKLPRDFQSEIDSTTYRPKTFSGDAYEAYQNNILRELEKRKSSCCLDRVDPQERGAVLGKIAASLLPDPGTRISKLDQSLLHACLGGSENQFPRDALVEYYKKLLPFIKAAYEKNDLKSVKNVLFLALEAAGEGPSSEVFFRQTLFIVAKITPPRPTDLKLFSSLSKHPYLAYLARKLGSCDDTQELIRGYLQRLIKAGNERQGVEAEMSALLFRDRIVSGTADVCSVVAEDLFLSLHNRRAADKAIRSFQFLNSWMTTGHVTPNELPISVDESAGVVKKIAYGASRQLPNDLSFFKVLDAIRSFILKYRCCAQQDVLDGVRALSRSQAVGINSNNIRSAVELCIEVKDFRSARRFLAKFFKDVADDVSAWSTDDVREVREKRLKHDISVGAWCILRLDSHGHKIGHAFLSQHVEQWKHPAYIREVRAACQSLKPDLKKLEDICLTLNEVVEGETELDWSKLQSCTDQIREVHDNFSTAHGFEASPLRHLIQLVQHIRGPLPLAAYCRGNLSLFNEAVAAREELLSSRLYTHLPWLRQGAVEKMAAAISDELGKIRSLPREGSIGRSNRKDLNYAGIIAEANCWLSWRCVDEGTEPLLQIRDELYAKYGLTNLLKQSIDHLNSLLKRHGYRKEAKELFRKFHLAINFSSHLDSDPRQLAKFAFNATSCALGIDDGDNSPLYKSDTFLPDLKVAEMAARQGLAAASFIDSEDPEFRTHTVLFQMRLGFIERAQKKVWDSHDLILHLQKEFLERYKVLDAARGLVDEAEDVLHWLHVIHTDVCPFISIRDFDTASVLLETIVEFYQQSERLLSTAVASSDSFSEQYLEVLTMLLEVESERGQANKIKDISELIASLEITHSPIRPFWNSNTSPSAGDESPT